MHATTAKVDFVRKLVLFLVSSAGQEDSLFDMVHSLGEERILFQCF